MSLCQSIEHELEDTLALCRTSMRRLLQLHIQVRAMVSHLQSTGELGTQGILGEDETTSSDELKLLLGAMQQEVDHLADMDCVVSNVADGVVCINRTFQDEALCFYWNVANDGISHWRFASEHKTLRKTFSEQALLDHFATQEA